MSEPLDKDERKWAGAKRVLRVGPFEWRVRRRDPDDPEDRHPTQKALEDLAESGREVGRAVAEIREVQWMIRQARRAGEWLDRILKREP